MIDTTVDGHVHTRLCHHAKGEMEEYVRAAVDAGLQGIIFLEHLEVGIDYFESTWLTEKDFAYYFKEGNRLKRAYGGRINIGLGVEAGYNPEGVAAIKEFLSRYPWDRVGVSYHFLKDGDRHLNMVSRKQANLTGLGRLGLDSVIHRYFEGLREAVETLPGDVVCHLDAVLRHHPELRFRDKHHALIDSLLAAMVRNNMALEVNTSGYDLRGQAYPSPFLVRKAVDLGVKLVAGSDAHRPQDVGRYFDRLAKVPLPALETSS